MLKSKLLELLTDIPDNTDILFEFPENKAKDIIGFRIAPVFINRDDATLYDIQKWMRHGDMEAVILEGA